MFGDINNVQRMLGTMSVPELVKIAQNPSSGDPTVQYAAISEIEKRKQMQPPPQAPVNQPTVIEKMGMEAMTPPQQTPVPGDPRAAGVAALVQQGARPPQRMSKGGPVVQRLNGQEGSVVGRGPILSRMGGIIDALSSRFDTTPRTPEEILALQQQFYGDGSYLDELIPGMKEDEERARSSRNSDLWLALAQAGFGMATTGSVGQGALMGLEQARSALGNYNDRVDNVRGRRERVGLARGQREDQLAGAGVEALLQGEARADAAQRDLVTTSAGIAQVGAQIEAMNARDRSQLEMISDALYQENRDQMVQDGTRTSPLGREIPFHRPYSREDATLDALQLMSGSSRGSDDLSETLAAARAVVDPANRRLYTPEQIQNAADTIANITTGGIGNRNSTTTRGRSGGGDRTQAPSSGDYSPQQAQQMSQQYREQFMSQHPAAGGLLDYRDGSPVYGSDRSQFSGGN